jgi:hypothetical protein
MNSNRENDQFDRLTSDMTLSHDFEKMSQHDAVQFLNDEGLPANVIHEHLVELFDDKALASSTVTRTVRQRSWTMSEDPKGAL